MHVEAMQYAYQLQIHSDEIERRVLSENWERDTPIHLEISIVYSSVIVRKLWEHYADLYREKDFDLEDPMPGLYGIGSARQATGLIFVNRIIHSQDINTANGTRLTGLEFESEREGRFKIAYSDIVCFIRRASRATELIHG